MHRCASSAGCLSAELPPLERQQQAHLFQKVAKVVNGRAPSASTSQGSYSTSPLKLWQCTPSAHIAAFASLSLTSDMGSYTVVEKQRLLTPELHHVAM